MVLSFKHMTTKLKNIPTNIITGFLGVGKTTAILHLLQHKPKHENWAVLVNEFGKIGIDGQVMQSHGAMIKEIPGGCMCCAAGVNMKVGLNALVKLAQPDRLLIEPTGIGHPQQILKILREPPYNELLDMRACISLLDPRNLQDERYTSNENFNQQIDIADVLVANKTDRCDTQDRVNFYQLVNDRDKQTSSWVQHGHLPPDLLNLPHATYHPSSVHQHHNEDSKLVAKIELAAGETFKRLENMEDGYFSCGWLFADQVFDFDKLHALFNELNISRIKATVLSHQGAVFFNCMDQDISVHKLDSLSHSRIELISSHSISWDTVEKALLDCLIRR